MDSILTDIKATLDGIPAEVTDFDKALLIYIASTIEYVNQMSTQQFSSVVTIATTWGEIFGDVEVLGIIKDYISMRCRMRFDTPQNSFLVSALEKEIQQAEFRIITKLEKEG